MNPITLNTKTIVILAVLLVLVSFFFGFTITPRESVEEILLNESYSGRILGSGYFQIDRKPKDDGSYAGNISGNFNGTVYQLGNPVQTLAFLSGTFNGAIFGTCINTECTTISGQISGDTRCEILGKIYSKKKADLVFPIEWQMFVGAVILIFVLWKTGIIDKIFGRKAEYQRLRYDIYYAKLIEFLREEANIQNIRKILDTIEVNDGKQIITWNLIQLSELNELITTKYESNIFWVMERDASFAEWRERKERENKLAADRTIGQGLRQAQDEMNRRLDELNKIKPPT